MYPGKVKRLLVAVLTTVALAGIGTATPGVAVAKTCSAGYKHAVINGAHKCLRKGQYCAKGADRQYHKYSFHCHSTGRLTR
jgi:hypothetical protein